MLTVVIPCLNEEKTIEICIKKCLESFQKLGIEGEVLVVDNGSSDNSKELAKNCGARVVFCEEKGYGNAIKFGFQDAIKNKSDFVLMGDADNTYDFLEIPLLYNAMSDDVDMVIGSRLRGKIEKGAMPNMHRYLGTPVLTFVLNLLYGTRITDSQCGMRLMRISKLEQIQFKTTGMEFASEILVEFAKHKFKIKEVPISLNCAPLGRVPHLRAWRDGWRHLTYLIKERF